MKTHERRQKIAALLSASPNGLTASELSRAADVAIATAYRDIASLGLESDAGQWRIPPHGITLASVKPAPKQPRQPRKKIVKIRVPVTVTKEVRVRGKTLANTKHTVEVDYRPQTILQWNADLAVVSNTLETLKIRNDSNPITLAKYLKELAIRITSMAYDIETHVFNEHWHEELDTEREPK